MITLIATGFFLKKSPTLKEPKSVAHEGNLLVHYTLHSQGLSHEINEKEKSFEVHSYP